MVYKGCTTIDPIARLAKDMNWMWIFFVFWQEPIAMDRQKLTKAINIEQNSLITFLTPIPYEILPQDRLQSCQAPR